MSAEEGHIPLLPPPPPPPPPPPLSLSQQPPQSPRFATGGSGPLPHRHGLVHPPSITTALSGTQARSAWSPSTIDDTPRSPWASAGFSPLSQAPWSANSRGTSPMALRPPTSMSVVEYNPQQWGRGGPTGGAYRPHANLAVPGNSADVSTGPIPSPPPPYSPPASQNTPLSSRTTPHNLGYDLPSLQTAVLSPGSSVAEYNSPASAVSMASPMSQNRRQHSGSISRHAAQGSNSAPAAPVFPPPPNSTRDRSTSRNRDGQRSLFGLSVLRNKSTDRSTTPTQNAMEALRQNTNEALSRAPVTRPNATQIIAQRRQIDTSSVYSNRASMYIPSAEPILLPPSSRRSASAGAIGSHTPMSSTEPSSSSGIALPPPPPGPPPSGTRSMSHDRAPSSVPILSMPTRRPPQRGTRLEPVPPTPAGWSEFPQKSPLPRADRSRSPLPRLDTGNGSVQEAPPPLRIDIGRSSRQQPASPIPEERLSRTDESLSSWSRSSRREGSTKGIRERRSESRAARDRAAAQGSDSAPLTESPEAVSAKPADLDLTSPGSGGGITRQKAVKKARVSTSPVDSKQQPRPPGRRPTLPDATSTPPFSPGIDATMSAGKRPQGAPAIPPKGLPTPPIQKTGQDQSPSSYLGVQKAANRPVSHILHTPNMEPVTTPPLVPPPVTNLAEGVATPESEKTAFARAALQRHLAFIEKEKAAADDKERLELFAEFIVTESRIRRDRYSAAFSAMAGDVIELTRDLWRSYQPSPTAVAYSAKSPPRADASGMPRQDSIDSYASASSPISRANFTPRTESESPSDATSSAGIRDSTAWPTSYQPVLSPIPSMAVSSQQDEELSRGRPSSRWWESSAGSQSGASQRLERSKRESKYMGVPKEARFNLQWDDEHSPPHGSNTTPRRPEQPGPSDYPPEKVGWHEEAEANGPQEQQHSVTTPGYRQFWNYSAPNTPDPHKLDVSRLITLPPPYPRHYPAMNNNHPDLGSVRSNLRSLTDLEEVKTTKEAFRKKITQRREHEAEAAAIRQEEMRHNIQEQLQLGQMTYNTASAAEADFNANESRIKQQIIQGEFNDFQPEVMSPLHAFLSERITRATACITQLKAGLSNAARDPTQSQPQEEGDEQPELLERLNLLKWLFEARENLHKELFELEGERNERYRAVVTTPMREAGHEDKLANAESFFRQDRQERKLAFEKSRLKRFEEFASCIEENVSRGVEDQLNAFWDIAPGLLAVVQKVPEDLSESTATGDSAFDIIIPVSEYEENPQYHDYPLQYLYSLLTHAEKSAYQFIESQTNLMCLLHEAMTGVMVAGVRLMESQRVQEGEEYATVMDEMKQIRRAEEERLTADLKEKVATVESQWQEALGSGLSACKERIERFLLERGGWDESLTE